MKKNKNGFTMVELLGVLIILALLIILISRPIIKMLGESKEKIAEQQEKAIENATEKWSIDNSDRFDDNEGAVIQIGLDVVFIFDVSGSMGYKLGSGTNSSACAGANCRYVAMVDAANVAMEEIAGDLNRMAIVTYSSGRGTIFQSLDYYTSANGIYLTATKHPSTESKCTGTGFTSSSNYICTSTTLKKNGVAVSPVKSLQVTGGTHTQGGIYGGAEVLLNSNDIENKIPVIILLTDGDPQTSTSSYCSSSICTSTLNSTGPNWFSDSSYKTQFYHALMAGYQSKKEVDAHYNNGGQTFFYTIGLGLDGSSNTPQRRLLEPTIDSRTAPYNYVTRAFVGDYTAGQLSDIFKGIATEVVEATKVTQVCVTVEELYNDGYLTSKDVKLVNDKDVAQYVLVSYNEPTNQFGYNVLTPKTKEKDGEAAYNRYISQKNRCEELIAEYNSTP